MREIKVFFQVVIKISPVLFDSVMCCIDSSKLSVKSFPSWVYKKRKISKECVVFQIVIINETNTV